MKKQIRQSVFETNSSSMHSLIVRDTDICVDEESPNIHVTPEELANEARYTIDKKTGAAFDKEEECCYYRHPFRILSSFEDKWKYAYANYQDYGFSKTHKINPKVQELIDIYLKWVPTAKSVILSENYGVDEALLDSWLYSLGIDVEEFLTNKRYVVVCDGDEYCIFDDFLKSGILNKEKFIVL